MKNNVDRKSVRGWGGSANVLQPARVARRRVWSNAGKKYVMVTRFALFDRSLSLKFSPKAGPQGIGGRYEKVRVEKVGGHFCFTSGPRFVRACVRATDAGRATGRSRF